MCGVGVERGHRAADAAVEHAMRQHDLCRALLLKVGALMFIVVVGPGGDFVLHVVGEAGDGELAVRAGSLAAQTLFQVVGEDTVGMLRPNPSLLFRSMNIIEDAFINGHRLELGGSPAPSIKAEYEDQPGSRPVPNGDHQCKLGRSHQKAPSAYPDFNFCVAQRCALQKLAIHGQCGAPSAWKREKW